MLISCFGKMCLDKVLEIVLKFLEQVRCQKLKFKTLNQKKKKAIQTVKRKRRKNK